MKQLIISIVIILLSLCGFSQARKDTTIQLLFTVKDYRELADKIYAAVDSKKTTQEIWFFIDSRAILIPPKQDSTKPKK